MTNDTLIKLMEDEGFPKTSIICTDMEYSLPDEAYLRSVASRYYALQKQIAGYIPQANDCEDFALQFMAHVKREHAMFGNRETGIAVGMAFGFTEMYGHAVNIAVIRKDGQYQIVLLEPQPDAFGVCLKPLPSNFFVTRFFVYF